MSKSFLDVVCMDRSWSVIWATCNNVETGGGDEGRDVMKEAMRVKGIGKLSIAE